MLKQEWKNIFHNTWIKVVLIAIILIPSIYACVFLGSMWDPYGNSGDLPVAVVNEDQEVIYNDEKLYIGQDLVNRLKENQSLDFHFVDAAKAQQGLEDGHYYMIITIPQDFSKNATTLLDEKPQKMVLHYTTHPGTNYVASKMDDSAIAKIKEQISSSVTKTYAETLFDSVGVLSNGLTQASDGSKQLLDGMTQLSDGNAKISNNLKTLESSTLTFQNGSSSLVKGIKDYTDGVLSVHNGVYSLSKGLNTLNQSTGTLSNGVEQLNNGANTLNQGLTQYTTGVSQAAKGTNELVQNNSTLNAGIEQVQAVNKQVEKGLSQLSSSLKTSANQLKEGNQNSSESLSTELKNINTKLDEIIENSSLDDNTKDKINGIKQEINTVQVTLKTQHDSLENLNQGLNEAVNSLENTTQNPNSEPDKVGLIQANQIVSQGLSTIQSGMKKYTTGVEQVNTGLNSLVDHNDSLLKGSQALSNGLIGMKQSTPTLVNGVQQLTDGANTLYQGTHQLVANNSTLIYGSTQLNQGAGLIHNGAAKLADGSMTLGQGIHKAKDGTTTLSDALVKGAQASQITIGDETTDMMASPIEVNHQEISKVDNNGHAMAPYMMSVALYVAALAFTLMYPIRRGIKEAKNGFKYWASKATVMYSVSTISAIVMVSALRYINGFEPQNLLLTYIFAILVSAAFMSLIMFISLTTGFIGEFLLLVFMIINLGGSAGTYPLDTAGIIYKIIHPFVPYTYSVDGFRKVISMTSPSLTMEIGVFVGIFMICSILTIIYYQYKNKDDKHLIPQNFEKVNE